MWPLTQTCPKALLDIAGEPFIVRQLRAIAAQGVADVVLCVGFLAEQIEAVVGDGAQFGLRVRYSPDGPKLLGTGGALRWALPLLGEAFFVMYGDSYLPISFAAVRDTFQASQQPACMTVLHNAGRWDSSNVLWQPPADGETAGAGQLLRYSKKNRTPDMHHVDYGLGIVRADVLAQHPSGESFDLADAYEALSLRGALAGHLVTERFYEIGSPQGLADTVAFFQARATR